MPLLPNGVRAALTRLAHTRRPEHDRAWKDCGAMENNRRAEIYAANSSGERNMSNSHLEECLKECSIFSRTEARSHQLVLEFRTLEDMQKARDALIKMLVREVREFASGVRESKSQCPGCDGHECDDDCQYPGVREGK